MITRRFQVSLSQFLKTGALNEQEMKKMSISELPLQIKSAAEDMRKIANHSWETFQPLLQDLMTL